jgi:chromosome partitioning protein
MVITLASTKGGPGKSSLAIQIAAGLVLKKKRARLIDADDQQSATGALAFRQETPRPALPLVQAFHAPELLAAIRQDRAAFDATVIDTGGRDSATMRAAMGVSDIALIVFAPRSFDVWALAHTMTLVNESRRANPALKVLGVLNQADRRGTDDDQACAAVAELGIEVLEERIGRRKAIASASNEGANVAEMSRRDAAAIAEIDALVRALMKRGK